MFKVRSSQIFTPTVDEAVAAKKMLDAGTPFTEVVEKYSTCPSKKNGGDLGWMPDGQVQSLMGNPISQDDQGKILGPVHSQYGYHILMITEVNKEEIEEGFLPSTTMNEVNKKFPDVHSLLFQKFHIGLPVSGYSKDETIESVSEAHGKSVNEVLNLISAEYNNKQVALISPQELERTLKSADAKTVVLDIREKWEWDIANIEGTQLVTKENNESILRSLSKDQEVVLIDWKQDRSPSFQKWLSSQGFVNVKCLEGGIDNWSEQIDGSLARYEIDEDDGYRYEDVFDENDTS